jgi:hypothetical protein
MILSNIEIQKAMEQGRLVIGLVMKCRGPGRGWPGPLVTSCGSYPSVRWRWL